VVWGQPCGWWGLQVPTSKLLPGVVALARRAYPHWAVLTLAFWAGESFFLVGVKAVSERRWLGAGQLEC
jgi:hypothetical protein